MKHMMISTMVCSVAFTLSGCGSSEQSVSVVDLDKVLEIFEKVLQPPGEANAVAANGAQPADAKEQAELKPVEEAQEDTTKTKAFLTKLAGELNKAKLIEDHIGVHMLQTGDIEGFIDENKDLKRSGTNEKKLFVVSIDYKNSRLVAIDDTGQGDKTYRRDRGYHYRPGGFFMGYMLGSMMGRQGRYYSGGRAHPGYGRMSPRGYHSGAVSSARSRAKARGSSYNGRSRSSSSRGARSGGSRSFRGGK